MYSFLKTNSIIHLMPIRTYCILIHQILTSDDCSFSMDGTFAEIMSRTASMLRVRYSLWNIEYQLSHNEYQMSHIKADAFSIWYAYLCIRWALSVVSQYLWYFQSVFHILFLVPTRRHGVLVQNIMEHEGLSTGHW